MVPYHTRARRHWPWVLVVAVIAVAAAVALVPDGGDNSSKTTPTTTPTSSTVGPTTTTLATYQVQRGDTLTSIAKHFGVSVASIAAQNHLTNPDQLTSGQTLQIPSVPPVQLTVTPLLGPPGQGFDLKLTGAKPGETVTFEVDSPAGKYTGPAHTAAADGSVSATYQTSAADTAGSYTVIAKGSQGTTAQTAFMVQAPSTTSTPTSS